MILLFIRNYQRCSRLKNFLLSSWSVAVAAAVNPKGTKIILAKGVSLFLIDVKPNFIKGPRKLSNPPL